MASGLTTQNSLLLNNLMKFYNRDGNMERILPIINGESTISLRLIDWFATNYSKKNYTVYMLKDSSNKKRRFKVYIDYKLKLKAYSKKRFDPFCRWDRINIPYKNANKPPGAYYFWTAYLKGAYLEGAYWILCGKDRQKLFIGNYC